MSVRMGIIGLGEAGGAIAAGLKEAGVEVAGLEARMDVPEVAARVNALGIRVCSSIAELVENSDLILSLTHAKFAEGVARDVVPLLKEGQVFSDWNSTGPKLKRSVGEIIAGSRGSFVDVAVMGAVPAARHKVPIIISGPGIDKFQEMIAGLDLNVEVAGHEAGVASATKMMRSILVKGLEALMLEFLLMARAYGGAEKVLEGMNGSMPFEDWNEFASYITKRTYLHGKRRAAELGEVIKTLEEAGIDPMVASGCFKRLTWAAELNLNEGDRSAPKDYHEFLDRIEEKTK